MNEMNDMDLSFTMCSKPCGGTMVYECIHPVCPLLISQSKNQKNKKNQGENYYE